MPQPDSQNSTLSTSRVLPATPDRVFAAFENADKLAIWWGPSGFSNTFATFEFTEGGNWIFTMHAPNGADFANESVFREIVRDRRIVLEHTVTPWFRLTVTLAAEGLGTLLTWDQEFESPEMANRMRPLAATANEQVLDRLQALLAAN